MSMRFCVSRSNAAFPSKREDEMLFETKTSAISEFVNQKKNGAVSAILSVTNETADSSVIRACWFDSNGHPECDFAVGDVVRLNNPQSPKERRALYAVRNINTVTGRIDIACLTSGSPIPTTETVAFTDIRQVSGDGVPAITVSELAYFDSREG